VSTYRESAGAVDAYRQALRRIFALIADAAPSREALEATLTDEHRLAAVLGDELAAAVRLTEVRRWHLVIGACAYCGEPGSPHMEAPAP
jgi:hypothetical protein